MIVACVVCRRRFERGPDSLMTCDAACADVLRQRAEQRGAASPSEAALAREGLARLRGVSTQELLRAAHLLLGVALELDGEAQGEVLALAESFLQRARAGRS